MSENPFHHTAHLSRLKKNRVKLYQIYSVALKVFFCGVY